MKLADIHLSDKLYYFKITRENNKKRIFLTHIKVVKKLYSGSETMVQGDVLQQYAESVHEGQKGGFYRTLFLYDLHSIKPKVMRRWFIQIFS